MPEPMTTIKVPRSLRDRISREASRDGSTAAALLARLLDEHDRETRFRSVRAAYAEVDHAYRDESAEWDATLADGWEDGPTTS